ncbi:MAG: IS66 family insertion sequence element accessory protein TnpB [Terrimicrobiaceae bacterium]
MLSFSGSLRVFVAVEACDMRKGFEGLSALVGTVLNEEVKSGALFAFSNRRRTRLKILYWDGYATGAIMGHFLGRQGFPRRREEQMELGRFP